MVAAEGFLVDMLYLIQDQLNFTAALSITVDGKFGGTARDDPKHIDLSPFLILPLPSVNILIIFQMIQVHIARAHLQGRPITAPGTEWLGCC